MLVVLKTEVTAPTSGEFPHAPGQACWRGLPQACWASLLSMDSRTEDERQRGDYVCAHFQEAQHLLPGQRISS